MRIVAEAVNYSDEMLIGDALHEMDRGADFTGAGTNGYVWHFSLGYYLRPRIVVEIGTRFGYSILSMFRSPQARERLQMVHCFDNESCAPGSTSHAGKHFAANNIPHTITIGDTQALDELPVCDADLCHVDADHSEAGCYHDCKISWKALRKGGWMVVDDAKYYTVASGFSRFLVDVNRHAEFYPSLRGFYMVQK